MFFDCKLGLKPPRKEELGKLYRLSSSDLDPLISRCPKDWAQGRIWNPDDLNNRVRGNCGPAAWLNWLMLMGQAAGRTDIVFTGKDADNLYRDLGWDGTEAGDDGVILLDMMCHVMAYPTKGIRCDGFYFVGFGDDTSVASSVTCAPLIVGASLTKACQGSDTWDSQAADRSNRVWGDHAYLYHSDSPGGGNGKSWGQPVFTTPDFRVSRWNEAYLPICLELMPHIPAERILSIARCL